MRLLLFFIYIILLPGLTLHAAAYEHVSSSCYAQQITSENFYLTVRGSSAIAGIGDWIFSNGTLCASITDPGHETYLSHRGGALVDLGFCGRNDDQWNTYHQLFNLSRDQILPNETITAEQNETSASITVRGEINGIQHRTRYLLNTEQPDQLQIETDLTRVKQGDPLFLFGALMLHPLRSLSPFSISSTNPELSKGFHHPFADTKNPLAMLKVMYSDDIHVLVGSEHLPPFISYGIQSVSAELIDKQGKLHRLREFAINDAEFTLLGNFVEPLWFDKEQFNKNGQPGLLEFMQTPFMDLAVGERIILKKKILVSPDIDVKKMVSRLAPEVDISSLLPKPVNKRNEGILVLPQGKTMQLVFKGIDGTSDPVFFNDDLDFRVGDVSYFPDISSNRLSLVGIDSDPLQVSIMPGHYKVYAQHGPEFSVESAEIDVIPAGTVTLKIREPVRVLETPRWLSADFHVHSEFSFDSTLPVEQRIKEFIAQGGEVLVSSEHKRTVDFTPFIKKMGLSHQLISVVGVELSGMAHTEKIPRTIGHNNVFPVAYEEQQFMGGTLAHEDWRLGDIIASYKNKNGDVVFQLNHPRGDFSLDADINFLNHLSINKNYDPEILINDDGNKSLIEPLENGVYRDIDFDAIELLNGESMANYELVKKDWFSFLRQGYKKTGTANSDSHNSSHVVAMPRNYVHIANDSVDAFSQSEFVKAIHKGDLIGSTGPLLEVSLNGKRMGETFVGTEGMLKVEIYSAEWIPVNQLMISVNGKLVYQQDVSGPGIYSVPLQFTEDGFITVEIQGMAGEIYSAIYPGFYPFAFSNPVYMRLR